MRGSDSLVDLVIYWPRNNPVGRPRRITGPEGFAQSWACPDSGRIAQSSSSKTRSKYPGFHPNKYSIPCMCGPACKTVLRRMLATLLEGALYAKRKKETVSMLAKMRFALE